jgi:hypothetical protein
MPPIAAGMLVIACIDDETTAAGDAATPAAVVETVEPTDVDVIDAPVARADDGADENCNDVDDEVNATTEVAKNDCKLFDRDVTGIVVVAGGDALLTVTSIVAVLSVGIDGCPIIIITTDVVVGTELAFVVVNTVVVVIAVVGVVVVIAVVGFVVVVGVLVVVIVLLVVLAVVCNVDVKTGHGGVLCPSPHWHLPAPTVLHPADDSFTHVLISPQ